MKKLLFILALLTPTLTFAVSFYDVEATDASQYYLNLLIGNGLFGGGYGSTTMARMFEILNSIALSVGSLIVGYIGVVSLLNTAQDGEVLGRKWSTFWVPTRSIAGTLLLVPYPSTGFSTIQMLVAWVVLQGIGAANAIWEVIIDGYAGGIGVADTGGNTEIINKIKSHPDVGNLAESILIAQTCMYGLAQIEKAPQDEINFEQSPFMQEGNRITLYEVTEAKVETLDKKSGILSSTFNLGVRNHPDSQYENICGQFTIYTELDDSEDIDKKISNIGREAQRIHNLKQIAFRNMFSSLSGVAKSIPREKNLSAKLGTKTASFFRRTDQIDIAKKIYANRLSTVVKPIEIKDRQEKAETAKKNGWIFLANYYKELSSSTPQTTFDTVKKHIPKKTNNTLPNYRTLNQPLRTLAKSETDKMKLYLEAANSFIDSTKSVTSSNPLDSQVGLGGSQISAMGSAFSFFLAGIDIQELTKSDNVDNPMQTLSTFGAKIVNTGEIAWLILTATAILLTLLNTVCSGKLGWKYAVLTYMVTTVFMYFSIIIMLWSVGMSLSFYLPLMPYLIFMASIMGWLFSVLEAVIGSPLIAVAFLSPAGEELSKITNSLMVLVNLFLTPTLLIFGYVFAFRLFAVFVTLVNKGFFVAISNTPGFSVGILPLGKIVAILIYVGVILAGANKCFSFIYTLKEKVIVWIGGQVDSFKEGEVLNKVKGAVEGATSAIGESQKAIGSKASEKLSESSQEVRNKLKEKAKEKARNAGRSLLGKAAEKSGAIGKYASKAKRSLDKTALLKGDNSDNATDSALDSINRLTHMKNPGGKKNAVKNLQSKLKKNFEGNETLLGAIEDIANSNQSTDAQLQEMAKAIKKNDPRNLGNRAKSAGQSLASAGETISEAAHDPEGTAREVASSIGEGIRNRANNFTSGASSRWDNLKENVNNILNKLRGGN